jgi:hypothetical protein
MQDLSLWLVSHAGLRSLQSLVTGCGPTLVCNIKRLWKQRYDSTEGETPMATKQLEQEKIASTAMLMAAIEMTAVRG